VPAAAVAFGGGSSGGGVRRRQRRRRTTEAVIVVSRKKKESICGTAIDLLFFTTPLWRAFPALLLVPVPVLRARERFPAEAAGRPRPVLVLQVFSQARLQKNIVYCFFFVTKRAHLVNRCS
jgi:hypothetical protein